jgi:hypothetical protein
MSEFSNQLGVSCSSYAEYFGVIGLKKWFFIWNSFPENSLRIG